MHFAAAWTCVFVVLSLQPQALASRPPAGRSLAQAGNSACGGPGEACCQQFSFSPPSCDRGNVCLDNSCSPCGSDGLRCCSGTHNNAKCLAGYASASAKELRCNGQLGTGTCEKCGSTDEPCCQQFNFSPPSCDRANICLNDSCKSCGSDGQICCGGTHNNARCLAGYSSPSAKELRCNGGPGTGMCEKCGSTDEPCCQQFTFSTPSCDRANICAQGTCVSCGNLGEPCCTSAVDSACEAGTVCARGQCTLCGGLGQPCCPDRGDDPRVKCTHAGNTMCLGGVCTACGRPGEPCCTGDAHGRITGSGTDAADSVCWSGATCPDSGTCPSQPVPAASEPDVELCTATYGRLDLAVDHEGLFFDACVGAAANTKCEDTVLADPDGSRIIPDWCIDFSGNRTVPLFDCPAGSAAGPPRNVFCSESMRTADCGNAFCVGGDWECEAWSPREDAPFPVDPLTTLKPGEAWPIPVTGASPITQPVYLIALACDGSLQILTRPGLGSGVFTNVIDGDIQTTRFCNPFTGTCSDVPVQIAYRYGTTIAWVATAASPAAEPGATSKASAEFFVWDRDGLVCVVPGSSRSSDRLQYEVTCLVLESPDDVPSGPLFPDSESGPAPQAAAT